MNDNSTRDAAAGMASDDTAELPTLIVDEAPATGAAPERPDALASTDSWRVAPEQQLDLEREAELGTLRVNLTSMAESHEHLEGSLRALTMNLRDLEERLGAKSSQIAGMERAVTAREVQLGELQQELALARAYASEADARDAARAAEDAARIEALSMQLQSLYESLATRERELAQLREVRAGDAEAQRLLAAEQERQLSGLQARLGERESQLEAAEQRHAELHSRHLAAEQRAADLQQALLTLEGRLELIQAEREQARASLQIAEERLRAGDTELRNRDQRIEHLTASAAVLKGRTEELERQLAERNALIHRLDHEAESSAAVLGKIQSNLARLDKDESVMPRDLLARLLVRNDGSTEIVQVLGRRTLIGRGVDCQLQIDAEFVSRRHALVLVGPEETVIEDLNSTNGVYVNGIRVARRRLAEGDQIMVGKTLFRYVVKPVTDRSG